METTLFSYAQPVKIKIERGQRGGMGWEITVHGDDPDTILQQIKDIEKKLMDVHFRVETITETKEG